MKSIIESHLTVSAVLLKFYQDVVEQAERGELDRDSLENHIADLTSIVGTFYRMVTSERLNELSSDLYDDFVQTATSFNYLLKMLFYYRCPDNAIEPTRMDRIYPWKDPGAEA